MGDNKFFVIIASLSVQENFKDLFRNQPKEKQMYFHLKKSS